MAERTVNLNPEQQEAVMYSGGPLLIIAGAGTGKTTVVTERIKWLIQEQGVPPEQILALTFTDKAAAEMESRVDEALPLGYSTTCIFTFHGFCEKALRADAVQIGLDPGFKIMTEAETQMLIRDNLYDFELDYFRPQGNPTKFISGLITHFSRLKDEDISPSAYQEWVSSLDEKAAYSSEEVAKFRELAHAYEVYERLKVENSVMDFADLISNTLKLFRERPNVLDVYRHRHPYLLIDEFQDTNFAQNQLAILLAGENRHITVVADDDQSIYRWRGAAVYNVLDFEKHFPSTRVVTLNRNYRSDQRILDRAYQLIQFNNPDRLEVRSGVDKRLQSQRSDVAVDEPIQVIWEERAEDEADCVAEQIEKLTTDDYSSIAILIRANSHAELFVQALARKSIPYQFLGPGRLFKQPEIKELIAYLRLIGNFSDDQAMYKLLTHPRFQISGRNASWLVSQAAKNNSSIFRAMEKLIEDPTPEDHGMSDDALGRISNLIDLLQRHLELVPESMPGEMLYHYLEDTGLLAAMKDPQNDTEIQEIENISAFFNRIKAYESIRPEARIHDFNRYLSFLIDANESPVASETDWQGGNAVSILTVHSSKGLEFDTVFLVNLVDLRFPSMNRSDQIPLPDALVREPAPNVDPHISEERRLFYVGITRARKRLFLTGAKFYSDAKRQKKMSPFIREALGEQIEPFLVNRGPQENRLFDIEQFAMHAQPRYTSIDTEPAPPLQIAYLSYSQIESFKTCPLHYKIDYLVKVPKLSSSSLSFGDSIHNTLRDTYRLIANKELSYNVDDVYEQALKIYQQNWIPVGYTSKKHQEQRFEAGKKILRDYFEQDLINRPKTLKIEEPFTFNISRDLRFGGRIDRIDQLSDGRLEVIDYKTGQRPEDRELKNGLKGLQLAIYALALSHPGLGNYPLDQLVLSLYYLESGEKVSLVKTADEIEAARQEILAIRDEIQQSDFACNHSYYCERGCDYKLFCG